MPWLQSGPAASTPSAGPSSAGIHPLLMAQDTTTTPHNRYKPMVPKFATVKVSSNLVDCSEHTDHRTHAASCFAPQANVKQTPTPAPRYESSAASAAQAEDLRKNPYYDARLGEGAGPRERTHRSMKFNAKGKFIRQGEQARSEARLEELKKRIAESSRKAGLEDEMETVEKQVRVRLVEVFSTSARLTLLPRSVRRRQKSSGGTKTTYRTRTTTTCSTGKPPSASVPPTHPSRSTFSIRFSFLHRATRTRSSLSRSCLPRRR